MISIENKLIFKMKDSIKSIILIIGLFVISCSNKKIKTNFLSVSYKSNITDSEDQTKKFDYATDIKCITEKNCNNPYGICIDDVTCKCSIGYANFVPAGQGLPDRTGIALTFD